MMESSFASHAVRRLTVTTPEHVEIRFETAGIGSRAGAQIIDGLVLMLLNTSIVLLAWTVSERFGAAMPPWAEEYGFTVLMIVIALLNGGYFFVLEYAAGGRTIGKKAMGIRVIQENGRPLSFLSAVIRNVLRVIDSLPMLYFVGIVFSFFHPHDKRLGDIAAGTVVVYELSGGKRRRKRLGKMMAKWEPYLPALTLEPWSKERVTEEEWALLSGFAERLPYLTPYRAEEIASGILDLLLPKLELTERWSEPETSLEAANASSREVAWVLALYEILRYEWEYESIGGGA